MVGRCDAVLLALSFVAVARATGRADPLNAVTFGYTRGRGTEGCPPQAVLQSAVIGKLGYDPFRAENARRLEVSVVVDGGMLKATLRLVDAGGADGPANVSAHRLVSSRLDCATLHPALTLAIALAIDPTTNLEVDAVPQLPPPLPPRAFPKPLPWHAQTPLIERSPMATPPSVDEGERVHTPPTVPTPTAKPIGFLYGGALIAIAASPTTTGGFQIGGGALWRAFSIALELRGDVPTRAHSVAGEIEVARTFFQVAPCFRAFAFGFCVLGSAGVSILRGHGYLVDRDEVSPYLAVGARLMTDVPIGRRLWLGVHADLLGVLTRVRARVDATVGYTDAPATGAFGVWVGGRFGDGK